jgi:hypothetical protein
MKARRLLLLLSISGLCLMGTKARAGNLLINGDFSAGNTGFTSGYTLVPNGTFTRLGDYGVINNPATAFTNGYASFGDHTTGTGLMMFGDGTSGTTPFWTETVTVSPDTSYTFTGWATAATTNNPAILRLTANGTPIGTDFPINATTPGLWQEFSDSLKTGSTTSLTLTISDVNPTPLVRGNDFAIDDLFFGTAVPEPSSLTLAVVGTLGIIISTRLRRTTRCGTKSR